MWSWRPCGCSGTPAAQLPLQVEVKHEGAAPCPWASHACLPAALTGLLPPWPLLWLLPSPGRFFLHGLQPHFLQVLIQNHIQWCLPRRPWLLLWGSGSEQTSILLWSPTARRLILTRLDSGYQPCHHCWFCARGHTEMLIKSHEHWLDDDPVRNC